MTEVALRFVREQIVLSDGRPVGDSLARDEWVERDLLAPIFARDRHGRPRYKLVYAELPRGHWKSGGAGAVAVTEAVLEPSTDVVIAAADKEQAAIVLQNLDGYLARNERLGRVFRRVGDERVTKDGSRVRVVSSDVATSWGLGGTHRRFRVIADELTAWRDEELWISLASATGKVEDAQSIILSNAGYGEESISWQWKVRAAAEREPWGYLFSAPGVIASWVAPEWVEQMRRLLPPAAFERVILNRWTSGIGDFLTAAQWARCVDETLAPATVGTGFRYVAGVDLGLVKDRTALAILHRDGELVVLDELQTWSGSHAEPVSIEAVERAIIDARRRFPMLRVVADTWQLQGSIQRLTQHGLRVEPFTFNAGSLSRISAALYQAVADTTLRVYPDDELTREVLGLHVVDTAGGWRFDHRSGGYSDRVVALAMALQVALATRPVRRDGDDGVVVGGAYSRDIADASLEGFLDFGGEAMF